MVSTKVFVSFSLLGLTVGLFNGRVVIIQFAAEQAQPLLQIEDPVIREVAGTTLNDQHTLVGEVLCQARRNHTAGGTTTDDNIVIAVYLKGREVVGSRHVGNCWRKGMRGRRGEG
jgi:hypothetical protein